MAMSELDPDQTEIVGPSSIKRQNQVAIDIDALVFSFGNMMSQSLTISDKSCIFEVPHTLQRHNEKAYIPKAFSIGPWHHNKENLKATEKIKLKYLKALLSKAPSGKRLLKDMIKTIEEIEPEARECYAGPIDVDANELVKILVLDGCFMIELFRKDSDEKLREDDDPIFNMSCMLQYLHHDLILLENQIPWLVLERLFNLTAAPESKPLAELALRFFHTILSVTPPPIDGRPYQGQKHLLDLLRNWLILTSEKEKDGGRQWVAMPSASDLADAGIKFRKGEAKGMLDIKFNSRDGVLEIPSLLLIQETTEAMFRNLISYEQCYPKCAPRITSYAKLLDSLINTNNDMDILTERKIITCNWLNPDEATRFFNKLYEDAYLKNYHYTSLSIGVNAYRLRRWPSFRAMLIRNYFGTPWAVVTIIVAIAFLFLTILQTIFVIIGAK